MPYWALLVGMLVSSDCVGSFIETVLPDDTAPPAQQQPPQKGKQATSKTSAIKSSTPTPEPLPTRPRLAVVIRLAWIGYMLSVVYAIALSPNVQGLKNDLASAQYAHHVI